MGILIGKVAHETMIVVDASPLPVEGTETRVNAQVRLTLTVWISGVNITSFTFKELFRLLLISLSSVN